jgi:hypothetical protein
MQAHETVPPSQQIYQRLKEANLVPKSQRAVDNLVAACDFLEKQNVEIGVAVVGKFCAGKPGGPATQSIRNNEDYRGYVTARRAEQALLPSRNKDEQGTPFRTGDVNIDAHLQTLEFELMKTKGELRNLRQALPKLGEYDLKAALEQGHLVINLPAGAALSGVARSAIGALLSPAELSKVGLELVKTGQVIAPEFNDAVLLTKPQVDSLRALLGQPTQQAALPATG